MKLTEKQRRFCEEYLIDLNATQAAARAGYRDPNIGRQLITKNNVSAYLAELMQKRSARTGIAADEVIAELKKVALSDAEIKGSDKLKALELLGKHLGLFTSGADDSAALKKLDEVLHGIESGF